MSLDTLNNSQDNKAGTAPNRKRNHLLWMGPVIVFVGLVSYFMVLAQFPFFRDFPWLNLPLILLGLFLSIKGLWRAYAFSTRHLYRGRILGIPGLLFSTLLTGLFCFYVFYWSYQMPTPQSQTLNLEYAPDVTLTDTQGRKLRLSDFRGRKVVLTFYRGHW